MQVQNTVLVGYFTTGSAVLLLLLLLLLLAAAAAALQEHAGAIKMRVSQLLLVPVTAAPDADTRFIACMQIINPGMPGAVSAVLKLRPSLDLA
jgi:hypothetical protein